VEESYRFDLPFELEGGAYADRLFAWFARHELTLDFGAPAADGGVVGTARVRIPATAALGILSSLQDAVHRYELTFGEIRRPRDRTEE